MSCCALNPNAAPQKIQASEEATEKKATRLAKGGTPKKQKPAAAAAGEPDQAGPLGNAHSSDSAGTGFDAAATSGKAAAKGRKRAAGAAVAAGGGKAAGKRARRA